MDEKTLLDHENAGRILDEGWKLFQQKGYRGVTVDELCRRCRLTKPTLYYYFHDKETLFVQVLSRRLHGFHQAFDQKGPLARQLQSVALGLLDGFQADPASLMRDREHIRKPANRQAIREAFHRELLGPLTQLMRGGMARGELKSDSPELLAVMYLGLISNFIGRAGELKTGNAALAGKLAGYFLKGAGL
jgi:AcrR family transcriptional regulator